MMVARCGGMMRSGLAIVDLRRQRPVRPVPSQFVTSKAAALARCYIGPMMHSVRGGVPVSCVAVVSDVMSKTAMMPGGSMTPRGLILGSVMMVRHAMMTCARTS
ncbi:MAG TPA: hypothetical protein VGU01_05965 [Sphingomicrobium sp.]|nr:hypothetical protein [Sphingomicrobium sp.]